MYMYMCVRLFVCVCCFVVLIVVCNAVFLISVALFLFRYHSLIVCSRIHVCMRRQDTMDNDAVIHIIVPQKLWAQLRPNY